MTQAPARNTGTLLRIRSRFATADVAVVTVPSTMKGTFTTPGKSGPILRLMFKVTLEIVIEPYVEP